MCLSGGWLNRCPKSVLQRHGGTMVKEGALPAGELESRDVSSLKSY